MRRASWLMASIRAVTIGSSNRDPAISLPSINRWLMQYPQQFFDLHFEIRNADRLVEIGARSSRQDFVAQSAITEGGDDDNGTVGGHAPQPADVIRSSSRHTEVGEDEIWHGLHDSQKCFMAIFCFTQLIARAPKLVAEQAAHLPIILNHEQHGRLLYRHSVHPYVPAPYVTCSIV